MIFTLFLVTLIIFFLIRLVPGDVIDAMLAQHEYQTAGLDRAMIEQRLGLDVPLLVQYGRWMGFVPQADGGFSGILQGDFGLSLWSRTPVIESIMERLPVTFELGLMALIVSQIIALPIGIYSAMRQDTIGDYIARSIAIAAIALPFFWVGTMVIVFPSLWWGYMPPIITIPFTEDPMGNLRMFIIPAIVLGMALSGTTMRMSRTMMLEVLRQDYIRTAWAKGLSERVIVTRHALKNMLMPVITIVGLRLPSLVAGTVIIEQIFCLAGMGRLLVGATLDRDYTVVSGITLFISFAVMLSNLMVDLAYAFLDPRLRYK